MESWPWNPGRGSGRDLEEGEARLRTDSILGGNTKGKNRRELKYEAKS